MIMFIIPKQHPNLADSKYTEAANKLLNNLLKVQADQKIKPPKQAKNRVYDNIQTTTLVGLLTKQ